MKSLITAYRLGIISIPKIAMCREYSRLQSELEATLQRVTELTRRQLDAFHAKDLEAVRQYDLALTSEVGREHRAVSSLRQHVRQHQCQPKARI